MCNYARKEKTHFTRMHPDFGRGIEKENFFGKLYRLVYFCVVKVQKP